MLNRRTLRIKIMQSLFAYDQCREANYKMALDQIEEHFKPNLNSMEVQDRELLKGQRKVARQLLEKKFSNPATAEGSDAAVNAAVEESITQYHKHIRKDFLFFSKNMVLEVEKINDLYYSVLGLLIAFADTAASDTKSGYKNFTHNLWIQSLRDNTELKKELLKPTTGWASRMDKVRGWFLDIVRTDTEFQKFNQHKSALPEDHKAIVKHLSRKVILGKGPINSYYEEEDIHWAEDQEIVKSLVDKTIKSRNGEAQSIELQKLSLDWEDDREFMALLFSTTIGLEEKHKRLIAKNTKNWEVDRLPLTDRIILEMAIAELITFSHIPVKVSINEYIELAKLYSTPKSRQFINGILDVISKELLGSGDMKKSGRGLIDNK
ncbi:MAG TPA: transcription antitermination factor NusB [Cyclobacteriaceae bacterium]|jgi:N utilization substance protein B|nr:transcription antitermination factor NusB [Cyclobacteriaceae bacterium]